MQAFRSGATLPLIPFQNNSPLMSFLDSPPSTHPSPLAHTHAINQNQPTK